MISQVHQKDAEIGRQPSRERTPIGTRSEQPMSDDEGLPRAVLFESEVQSHRSMPKTTVR